MQILTDPIGVLCICIEKFFDCCKAVLIQNYRFLQLLCSGKLKSFANRKYGTESKIKTSVSAEFLSYFSIVVASYPDEICRCLRFGIIALGRFLQFFLHGLCAIYAVT
jgi:hypothetical protein